MKQLSPDERKQYVLLCGVVVLFIALTGVITALCMPFFSKLSDPAFQAQFQEWINSLGFGGWLVVLGIQIFQIVVAFIPGEPVELIAGVLYGAWGGLATCLLGVVLASSAIFFTTRRFGQRLVVRIFGQKKVDEFKFLNNAQKVETVTFILFLIPGTPKDMLTYLAGISKIKPSRFLLLSTFARIPSIITSTLMGATMSRGNWITAALVFLFTLAIGLVGLLYKQKIMDHLHRS
ncbi:TVP38/TMEM64 family protein [Anaerotruncus colihominis]|uniref:TVP38/TMEM64 family membrane protein n=1 Tax=Anaerotruncus colihominis TaxID=169435 RepID=A0A845SWM7_9FIRM|nr:VTT domain-containing protein [Anaerotruncus colihominis]MCR2027068.1 VTT domain-containing protein [Anaerotruncus colihominis]NDO38804.1 TVP38/TMEM64 family protein [Anaerotruncus colihominis]